MCIRDSPRANADIRFVFLALLVHELQSIFRHEVIGIAEHDVFAASCGHPIVASGTSELVLLMNYF